MQPPRIFFISAFFVRGFCLLIGCFSFYLLGWGKFSPMVAAGFLTFVTACIPLSKIGDRVKRTETIVILALAIVSLLTWDAFIEKPHIGDPYWYAWGSFMFGVAILGAHAIIARKMEPVTANNSFEIGRHKGAAQ